MFARLAFACAINVDPDVLIVDEVLSVGDMAFQLKCFKKFQQFKEKGKTILFVTHSIADSCALAIYTEVGTILHTGDFKIDFTPIDNEVIDLQRFAQLGKQGVLLLNATLTVRAHQAASHQRKGWEEFTDAAIKALSKDKEHLVFILWGGYARSKANLIDMSKHLILESVHPSPLSANRGGWFGNHHFSRCNAYLQQNGIAPIQW